jgi:hypothetical protein
MITALALFAALAAVTGTAHYSMSAGMFFISFIGMHNKPADAPPAINRMYIVMVYKALACAVLTITAAFFAGVWL